MCQDSQTNDPFYQLSVCDKQTGAMYTIVLAFMFLLNQTRSYLQLTVACIKMNRPEIAERAVEVSERRIQTSVLNTTPSFLVYKAHTHIKIQTFISLTNNLTINF